jgi:hypothetical protein
MTRSIFLLAPLAFCFTAYAAGSEKVAKAGTNSQARRSKSIPEYVFHNRLSPELCIDPAGGTAKPGVYVKQRNCNEFDPQTWVVDPILNEPYYHIRNGRNLSVCMGVEHGRRALRANIKQGTCNNHPDQKWTLERAERKTGGGRNHVSIKNAYGLCLGVERGITAPAQLKQNKCFGNWDQIWVMVKK